MNHLLVQYTYLQLLDLMTTMAFLLQGVQEANPLVRFAMRTTPSPLGGLIVMKLLAVMLGVYCWRMRRDRVLSRMNLLFAVVVAWNLVALILASVRAM